MSDFLTKAAPPKRNDDDKFTQCPVCRKILWGNYYYEQQDKSGHSYAPGSLIYVGGFCDCVNVAPQEHYAVASSYPQEARELQPQAYAIKCEHCGGRILQEWWWWKMGGKWISGRNRCACPIGGYKVTHESPPIGEVLGNEQEVMGL